ncbi:tetratricopeptide repeat protein [Streptomyces tailanensis]|uniref:tetratricopeptide repeat protein n=1 Tax=Streptomyces tailanensis TaxID=2569858 RepID=UPI00122DE008|nr:tetratricopeptide repeat protein [Streptomyces tailanensis]
MKSGPALGRHPDPAPKVPPGFTATWQEFRSGLRQVHTAVALALGDDREGETEALRAVARTPVFDLFGPRDGCTDEERGRWLADRVARGVQQARDTAPAVVPGGLGGAAGQALVLWCLHVVLGIPLEELGAAQDGDIDPPLRGRDLAQKIEGRMWLSARPTGRAEPGIVTLYHEVQAALRDRFPTREDGGDEELARAHFGYEWRRLTQLGLEPERDLLTLLSTLAPDPLPVSFLASAWGPLPGPLRDLGSSTHLMALALRRLLDRGLLLVTSRDDTRLVGIPQLLHPLPVGTLDPAQRRRWANIALRFLSVALRGDTHDHDSWPEWRDARPHVLHLVALAEEYGEGLQEAADLMDRLSVFHRVRGEDPDALTAARRALSLYERAGNPSPVKQATYLTNYAVAVRAVEGPAAALEPVERALAVEANRSDADHAQTLNLYASILESAGRPRDADEAFRQSIAIARRCHEDTGSEEDAEALAMVLNDYSVHLLRHAPEKGTSARAVAGDVLRMLDEAENVTRPGGYGTEQIMLNRADAMRRLGRPEDARQVLEQLVALCEEWDEPTLLLFAALVDLAEVLNGLGDPRHEEVLRRAHEVDDFLATS